MAHPVYYTLCHGLHISEPRDEYIIRSPTIRSIRRPSRIPKPGRQAVPAAILRLHSVLQSLDGWQSDDEAVKCRTNRTRLKRRVAATEADASCGSTDNTSRRRADGACYHQQQQQQQQHWLERWHAAGQTDALNTTSFSCSRHSSVRLKQLWPQSDCRLPNSQHFLAWVCTSGASDMIQVFTSTSADTVYYFICKRYIWYGKSVRLSVCPSVCLPATLRYCVKTREHRGMRSSS